MYTKDLSFGHRVYELMTGMLDVNAYPELNEYSVENEFEDSSLGDAAYQAIFEAKERLLAKLNVNEDHDIELILSHFSDLTEYLCLKMYEYGVFFAKQ